MKNLLISATGKEHKMITDGWIIALVASALVIAACFFINNMIDGGKQQASYSSYHPALQQSKLAEKYREAEMQKKETNKNIVLGGTVLVVVIFVAFGFLIQSTVEKTSVHVYEDGVEGSGVAPSFPQTIFTEVSEFRLKYDQISSVEVVDSTTLIINAINAKHKIYAMNAKEVRDVILAQKESTGQA